MTLTLKTILLRHWASLQRRQQLRLLTCKPCVASASKEHGSTEGLSQRDTSRPPFLHSTRLLTKIPDLKSLLTKMHSGQTHLYSADQSVVKIAERFVCCTHNARCDLKFELRIDNDFICAGLAPTSKVQCVSHRIGWPSFPVLSGVGL